MSKYVVLVEGKLVGTALETEKEIVDYMVGEGFMSFTIYESIGEYAPVVQKKEASYEPND